MSFFLFECKAEIKLLTISNALTFESIHSIDKSVSEAYTETKLIACCKGQRSVDVTNNGSFFKGLEFGQTGGWPNASKVSKGWNSYTRVIDLIKAHKFGSLECCFCSDGRNEEGMKTNERSAGDARN